MGVTNFPDGLAGVVTGITNSQVASGTAIVTGGSVDVATGLTSVTYAVACPYGVLPTAGTAGSFVTVTAEAGSSGTAILRAYDFEGTAAASAGTAAWLAIGT